MSGPLLVYAARETTALSVGMEEILGHLQSEAVTGGLELDIIRTGGRGLHFLEPLIEVGEARLLFGPLEPGDVPSLIKGRFSEAHPKCLGPAHVNDYLAKQDRLVFERAGLCNPLDVTSYRAAGGLRGWEASLALTPDRIIEEIETSGLRGRGGAGFPAAIKWRTVAQADAEARYIVCNADEGDAGTFSDRLIMESDPLLLIEGMVIAARATGATRGYIYLRSEYPLAKKVLGDAIDLARQEGLLGSSDTGLSQDFDIELRIGAGSYVCGEETAMLESLEGKRGEVRSKPPLPAHKGLFGKPTLINNVVTLASVPWIIRNGGGAYAEFGTGRSRGTLPVQLGGNVRRGGLVEVPFGVSLRELVYDYGDGTRSGRPVRAIQIGGPLGSYLPESFLDLPLDYEALSGAGAAVGHGGIIVFDDTVRMDEMARFAFEFCAKESCGKCTPCRIGSVRGAEVMEKVIAGKDVETNLALIADLCETMKDGSLCAMGALTPQPVEAALKHFPEDFGR